MDAKLVALLDLGQRQGRVTSLFLQAEAIKRSADYGAASLAYRDYLDAGSAYLQAASEFNGRYPQQPYSLKELAQVQVNGLLVAADIESSLGNGSQAKGLREQAIALSREHLGREGTAESQRSLAGALTLQGCFNEAVATLFEVRDMLLEGGDSVALARVAIDLADVLQWLGDVARAKDEIDHAHAIIKPLVGDRPVTTQVVFAGLAESVASIFGGKGNPGTAERSMQLYREFVEVTYYRGLLAKALQQWDEAERCFEKVLPDYRGLGVAEAIEFQLAQVQAGRGEHAAALVRLQGIESVFERGAFRAKRPVLQRAMAQCLVAVGDTPQAARLLHEAIEDLQSRHPDPDALWRAQDLQARVLADEGQAQAALRAYADALETVRRLRVTPLGYRLDSTFLADKVSLYARAIGHALRCGQAEACCEFMDSLKSRTLSAVLGTARAAGSAGGPLAEQFDALSRELDGLEYAAYRDPDAAQPARWRQLLGQRRDLAERIRITDARWRGLSESPQLDLKAVQSALASRSQAALSLHDGGDVITSVLLWQGRCHAQSVPVSPALRQKLVDYAGNLTRAQPNVYEHDLSAEFGVQASDLVAPALLAHALQARSLVVVPHGVLHLLPWAALIHQGRRLFESLPVGVYPNLALLAGDAASRPPAGASMMGVAEYAGLAGLGELPAVAQELGDIAALYRGAGLAVQGPFVDAAATAAAFQGLMRGSAAAGHVLHLSCHGTLVAQEPMSSGLLLADSKLDAAEVAAHRLPFDEVVLSACSTGWRPTNVADVPLDADEILGIPGAFLEAGARSVLVSIPKAEDRSAAALTTAYHRGRIAGQAPLQAFQAAQRQLLVDGVPPTAWAGFALYSYV